eukprot:4055133-Prymnesium_polylepis.1
MIADPPSFGQEAARRGPPPRTLPMRRAIPWWYCPNACARIYSLLAWALIAAALAFVISYDFRSLTIIGLQQIGGKQFPKRRSGPLPFRSSSGASALADPPTRVG